MQQNERVSICLWLQSPTREQAGRDVSAIRQSDRCETWNLNQRWERAAWEQKHGEKVLARLANKCQAEEQRFYLPVSLSSILASVPWSGCLQTWCYKFGGFFLWEISQNHCQEVLQNQLKGLWSEINLSHTLCNILVDEWVHKQNYSENYKLKSHKTETTGGKSKRAAAGFFLLLLIVRNDYTEANR